MSAYFPQLTDKYIIPSEASWSHNDAHVKKHVGHLGLLRKWQKKNIFLPFSQKSKITNMFFWDVIQRGTQIVPTALYTLGPSCL
jgi:hypothetical protein